MMRTETPATGLELGNIHLLPQLSVYKLTERHAHTNFFVLIYVTRRARAAVSFLSFSPRTRKQQEANIEYEVRPHEPSLEGTQHTSM